jgi:PAS domain S-box-containing protein
MRKPGFPSARRIAVLYAFFGGAWILLSDRLLAAMVSDPQKMITIQTYKGWAFVAASTLLLYVAVKHEFRGRRRVEETLQRERDFNTTLIEASPVFFVAIDADGKTLLMNDMMLGTLGYTSDEVKGKNYLATFVPEADQEVLSRVFRSLMTERKPTVNENRVLAKDGRERLVEWHGRPIFKENGDFDYFFGMGIDITGRRQAEVQAKRRLRHLAALHAVDMVITASLDLNVTLNVFLEQLTSHLHVDAAAVLSFSSHTQTLTFSAGSGFRTDGVQRTLHRLGECSAGKAALDRRTVAVFNLPQDPEDHDCTQLVSDEGFVSYFAVPLISKGNVNGVLEVYNRSPLEPDPEWVGFLESMALQAAIAIDNATLFRDIQRAHSKLTMAYDTTLEGWARALEIRDKETKGHTDRVLEMTLRIARGMGMEEEELVHIRRGVLLHDIGKMSTPDSILFSEGPLTDDQRQIMESHPRYAFDLLSPIHYLRPALDIPYCHHEKWDGSGYPRGLKGEQIPLAARIFTVVDVWDALLHERRYHPAWPREKVREHIKSLAGIHFDPEVVKTFLELEKGG